MRIQFYSCNPPPLYKMSSKRTTPPEGKMCDIREVSDRDKEEAEENRNRKQTENEREAKRAEKRTQRDSDGDGDDDENNDERQDWEEQQVAEFIATLRPSQQVRVKVLCRGVREIHTGMVVEVKRRRFTLTNGDDHSQTAELPNKDVRILWATTLEAERQGMLTRGMMRSARRLRRAAEEVSLKRETVMRLGTTSGTDETADSGPKGGEKRSHIQDVLGFAPEKMTRPTMVQPKVAIFLDGSGTTSSNQAAAAVVVREVGTVNCHVLTDACPQSTNEVGEWTAMVAGLRVASEILEKINDIEVVVLTDSENVYKGVTGPRRNGGGAHSSLYADAIALYQKLEKKRSKRLIVAKITGHVGRGTYNLADHAARRANVEGRGFSFSTTCSDDGKELHLPHNILTEQTTLQLNGGDIHIPDNRFFPKWSLTVTRQYSLKLRKALQAPDAQQATPIYETSTFEEYLRLRSLPARQYVPPLIRPFWIAQVKQAVNAVTTATDDTAKDRALIGLLSLPNIWLPSRMTKERITTHIRQGTPFSIQRVVREEQQTAVKSRVRLERAIERKAKNHDLRGALNILRSQAVTGCDLTYEEKVSKVEAKIPGVKMVRSKNGRLTKRWQHTDDEAALQITANSMRSEKAPRANISALNRALAAVKRNAAQAIDGWSRGLLDFVVDSDATVAEGILEILRGIVEGDFGDEAMKCVLATRMVPIPKTEGGVRPISVSNFFLKLAGGIALKSGRDRLREWQYAERGNVFGAKIIIHECRRLLKEGYTIAKFDLRNAYGEMPRALCAKAVESAKSPALSAYFNAVYLKTSWGILYGDKKHTKIPLREGVRQGDGTSAYIFCKALDIIIDEILQMAKGRGIPLQEAKIFCYMDDLTLAIEGHQHAPELASIVSEIFGKYGMEVNTTSHKSSAITPDQIDLEWQAANMEYVVKGTEGEFSLLGASLSEDMTSFIDSQKDKQKAFFDLLKDVHLHPALLYSILRICGMPRIGYLCNVTPPDAKGMDELTAWFDEEVVSLLDAKFMLNGRIKAGGESTRNLLYTVEGLNFIRYNYKYADLYEETAIATSETARGPRIMPATTEFSSAERSPAELTSLYGRYHLGTSWMFYTGRETDLSPAEYKRALCSRLGCLDCTMDYPRSCDCGAIIQSDASFIEHSLSCPKGQFTSGTGISYSSRHDAIKHQALVLVPRMYGIQCTEEPDTYSGYYQDDTTKSKPDVEYHTPKHIAIDLSIVYRPPNRRPGDRAKEVANTKVRAHDQAVTKRGHLFAPFIIETDGYMHTDAIEVLRFLRNQLHSWQRPFFNSDILRALSVNLERQKSLAIEAAIQKQRRPVIDAMPAE